MQKYKNVSNDTLHLDSMTHTIHLSPGETMTLPASRDVRYYSGLKKLIVVRDNKHEGKPRELPRFSKPKVISKKPKSFKKLEDKVDINNENNEMENK